MSNSSYVVAKVGGEDLPVKLVDLGDETYALGVVDADGWTAVIINTATTTLITSLACIIGGVTAIAGTLGNVTCHFGSVLDPGYPAFTPDKGQEWAKGVKSANGFTVVTAAATILEVKYRLA